MKDEQKKTIEVIYESSCEKYGGEITKWLVDEKIAENSSDPAVKSDNGLFHYTFEALHQIAADSVIVFVSDEAATNKDWLSCVNSVSGSKRIIPAGSVETVDYKKLPKKVEEINFIRIDKDLQRNILDALTTDPDFYSLKNQLLIKCKYWSITHRSTELLTDLKQIKRYTGIIERRSKDENDPGLRAQLKEIGEYLEASRRYARKMLLKSIGQWVYRGIVIAAAVMFLYIYFNLKEYYGRLAYANLALSFDANTADAQTGAIKMAEVFTNPFSDQYSVKIAYENLVMQLDKVWPQTPIGINYKNIISDIAIPSGEQFVWSADSGGRVICWDTYTGQIKQDEKISETDLVSLSVSESEQTLVALDANGIIYTDKGNGWKDIGTLSKMKAVNAQIKTTDDTILIFDDHSYEIYDMNGKLLTAKERSGRTILDIGFVSEGEIITAEAGADGLITALIGLKNDASKENSYKNIKTDDFSKADILNDMIVITDSDGQVWKISDNTAVRTSLLLPKVIGLRLVDRSTIVYHERNIGTGIYDIDGSFDYGDVLSDIRGINSLYASDSLMVAGGLGMYNVYPIKNILKINKSDIQDLTGYTVYDQTEAHPDGLSPDQIGIHGAEITPNGIILLNLKRSESENTITAVLDPASVISNSSGHISPDDVSQVPENALKYNNNVFSSNDLPSVVGIRSVPADDTNDKERTYLIVGCKDGTFSELYLNPDGAIVQTVSHIIPSRCAVAAVYQTDNGYLIEDEAGRLWSCDDGIGMIYKGGCLDKIKNKLHSAVSDDLKRLVSPELWQRLELKTFPGGNGEVWE